MNKRFIIAAITLESLLAGLAVTILIKGKTFGSLTIALLLQWPSSALLAQVEKDDPVRGIAVCCLILGIQTCLIWGGLRGLSYLFTKKKEERCDGWPKLVYAQWPSAHLREKTPNQAPDPTRSARGSS